MNTWYIVLLQFGFLAAQFVFGKMARKNWRSTLLPALADWCMYINMVLGAVVIFRFFQQ